MIWVLVIFVVSFLLYILSTCCRRGHPGLSAIHGYYYAHRGLHGADAPENSLLAFEKAAEKGYGIELDVHLLADGNLAIIHDSSLLRTAGVNKQVEMLTLEELKEFSLDGTEQKIPTLQEVLSVVNGEVPLIVEVKPKGNNYAALCEKICSVLGSYSGTYCMESFDPRCVFWLRKHRPDIVRGQLTVNYLASGNKKLPLIMKLLLTHQMLNFLTLPDFVAYRYSDRKTFSNAVCMKLWCAVGVSWTIKSEQDFNEAVKEGWIPIFEGFCP